MLKMRRKGGRERGAGHGSRGKRLLEERGKTGYHSDSHKDMWNFPPLTRGSNG